MRRAGRWAFAGWLLGGVLYTGGVSAQVLDAIVARVDQSIVTWSEVLQEQEILRVEGASETALDPAAVVDTLIRRRLLVAEAEKLRIDAEEEAIDEEVRKLEGRNEGAVSSTFQRLGLERRTLERRARDLALVRQYLDLRREMTFVPESTIRKQYVARSGGGGSLAEARDQLRDVLAAEAFQEELNQWVDRQVAEGRVVRNPVPGQ